MRFLRNEDGQALIETALSLTILILVTLGAAEFGQVTAAAIEVDDAAKSAAQYAAQSPGTASNSSGMQTAAKTSTTRPRI